MKSLLRISDLCNAADDLVERYFKECPRYWHEEAYEEACDLKSMCYDHFGLEFAMRRRLSKSEVDGLRVTKHRVIFRNFNWNAWELVYDYLEENREGLRL